MSDSVSGSQLLRMLGNRKLLIVFTALTTLAVALAVTLTQPRKYFAEATILVEVRDPQDEVDRQPNVRLEPNYMTTQLGILSSRRVAEDAVDKLLTQGIGMDMLLPPVTQPGIAAKAKKTVLEWLQAINVDVLQDDEAPKHLGPANSETVVDHVLKHLAVDLTNNSRLMTVGYTDVNPETSSLIVNAIADAYVETRLAISQNPAKRIAEWMELQLVDFRERLTEAQDRLTNYQQEKGIVATDSRLDVEVAYLNSLTNQLVEAEAEAGNWRSRIDQIDRAVASGQPVEAIPEIYKNQVIQDLKSELAKKDSVVSELSAEYGERHPVFVAAKADADQIRRRLKQEIQATVQGVRGDQVSAVAREEKLRAALDSQREKLLSLRQSRGDLPALVREVENAQSSYETALQEAQRFSLIGSLDETNAVILNRATTPSTHSSPKVKRNLLSSIGVGLLLGIVFALILESTQRRVRHSDDLRDLDDIPVLAEVPHL